MGDEGRKRESACVRESGIDTERERTFVYGSSKLSKEWEVRGTDIFQVRGSVILTTSEKNQKKKWQARMKMQESISGEQEREEKMIK